MISWNEKIPEYQKLKDEIERITQEVVFAEEILDKAYNGEVFIGFDG